MVFLNVIVVLSWFDWDFTGVLLGLCWGYVGVIVGFIGVVLGLYWGFVGVILGFVGVILRYYWSFIVILFGALLG